ncbi:outer membrane beta-barrel protein [Mucilaginibacter phyllosphaerae]|uniref:Outer membrane receptor protein involved in Fe transport n=1 Tax=Mucilaginibacter phyllosphaerae TaxID=1812349 RepID=A0A4Y8AK17_9SPHI|nr:outer membrane beta-barrel protein [Mucilaginibacter phyllosphaerae]MBB3967595.1 outer membrane receptor protein involved in Fe transport [Mucilaginibacter phyllosphaerae]TEW69347.1 hypothetical protein E2R65_04040 [Mucilaginibacter phyllosphaerae]GGH21597.1 TonB-dependent receptor [Mucilaginibacter phyllosphaerae]
MRVKFGCFFTVILAGLFNFCYAQTGSSVISGSVWIQNNQAADAATVVLLKLPDSAAVASALVNPKGNYRFTAVSAGAYLILATRLGYKKAYSAVYTLKPGQTVSAGIILLSPASSQLKEVAIVGRKPYVEVRPGKTIINPSASIIADGQSALDILRQSPGVRVDNNENVSISGRQDALILIDGKATNLSGADLTALLKSTQGSNIDRMELITGGSAKYDAAAGGIINIIYKKGKNLGTNGTLNTSAGYGTYYKANAGLSLNHRTAGYNIFGNYNFTANKTFREILTDRGINYAGVQSDYNTMYNNIQQNRNHAFALGTDFFLSPGQSIGFLVNGFVSDNVFHKNNDLHITNQGVLDSVIKATSGINRDITNINYNLNYNGTLDKTGRSISANITYNHTSRKSAEYITNEFFDAAGAAYRNPLLLQNISPTKINNWTGTIAYTNPLPKDAKLEAGLKYSYTNTDNNLVFGPQVNGIYTIDNNYSNYFIFKESIGAGYVNYNGKFGKFDLESGLRGEYTYNNGTSVTNKHTTIRKYFNLFPTVLLNYRYNDNNEYALSFTRGITRPGYDKLNPFLYFVDLYNYQAGNPYLMPEYNSSVRLTHTYKQQTVTALYATLLTGASFPFYNQNDTTKISTTTNVNLGRLYTYGININTPVTFTTWWRSTYDIDASYQRYVAYSQYGNLNKGTGDVIINTTQYFQLNSTITAQLSGKYETATFYGINQFRPNYFMNAGISKQILNKLGRLSLVAEDIFRTNRDRAYTNYQNLNRSMVDRREYRKVTLSFSYRFGKATVKSAAKHVIGNEDIQNRIRLNN